MSRLHVIPLAIAFAATSLHAGCTNEAFELNDDLADRQGERIPRSFTSSNPASLHTSLERAHFRPLDIVEEINAGNPFSFCESLAPIDITGTERPTLQELEENAGLSIGNARWLAYLSGNEYAHFGYMVQVLRELGFGAPGDGLRWLQHASILADLTVENVTNQCRGCAINIENIENYTLRKVYKDEKIQFFDVGSTQVVWAEHETKNMAVLVFRGTEPTRGEDLFTDLQFAIKEVAGWGGAHQGFVEGWTKAYKTGSNLEGNPNILNPRAYEKSIKELVLEKLATVANKSDFKIWISGHSLGGALAMVAATTIVDSIEQGLDTPTGKIMPEYSIGGVYTFGQPRTGQESFARAMRYAASGYIPGPDGARGGEDDLLATKPFPYLRFRHGNDVITQSPKILGDLVHTGQSYHLTVEDHDLANLWLDDPKDTKTASSQFGILGQVDDHDTADWYYPRLREIATSNPNNTKSATCQDEQ